MANATPDKYARNTVVSGNVRNLAVEGGTAVNQTARYTTGGVTAGRRWRPNAANSVSVDPPSVGTAAGNEGWRITEAYDPLNAITILSGSWAARLRYKRSGTAVGEVDQSARVTAILYRVTAAGTFVSEIARGSSDVTFTTTTQTLTITMAGVAAQDFVIDDRVQIEVYCQALTLGVPTAPLTNEDLILIVGETEANGGTKVSAPEHNKHYVRTAGPSTITLVATFASHLTLHRTMQASITLIATLARQLTLRRVMEAAITLLAAQQKKVLLPRSTAITLLATRGPLKIKLPRSGSIALVPSMGKTVGKRFSVSITLVGSMARKLILRRTLSAAITLVARAWAKLPFDKIPGGGGTTIIRRITNIFED